LITGWLSSVYNTRYYSQIVALGVIMQDLSGRKLGNYELRERLGRGGMAEVYKAYQAGMDRFVAVKVMLGHLATDESFIERFKREAQAVGRLRHPHIVQIFDFGIENDVYFMAMEFIQGRTLKDYLHQQKRLPVQDALFIMRQLADGLDYAHRAGMIHRDLKPANVMFINEEKKEVVLTDFGIARIMGASGLTGTGMAVGTPAYMSPEAGRGETTDERADIYALGIMLYEMVTGQTPYDADTPLAVIMKHINAPLPTRKDFGDIIPESVERLVLKCIAKEPADRYASAGEFRDAIEKTMTDLRHSAVTKPVDVSHDNKATTMASIDKPTTTVASAPKAKVSESPQSSNRGMMVAGVVVVLLIAAFLGFQFFGNPNTNPVPTNDAQADTTEVALNPTAAPSAEETEAAAVAEATGNPDFPLTLGGEMPPNPFNLDLISGISDTMDEVEELILEGKWEEAQAYVDGILESDPENFSALFARSELLSLQYDTVQDLEDANTLVRVAPDSEWGYIALTDAYLSNPGQDFDAALAAIEQAFSMAPENPHVLWRYAALAQDIDSAERSDYAYSAEALGASGYRFVVWFGNFLIDDRDYSRALPYVETLARYGIAGTGTGSYDREQAFWGVISCLILLDRAPEAYAVFTEYGWMDEADNYSLYQDAAYIAYRAGEFEQAREWATTAEALSGDAYAAKYVRALIMGYVDDDVDAAIALLQSLVDVSLYSRFINWEFQEDINLAAGRMLANADRYEEALVYYGFVVDATYEAWIHEERADVYLALGNVDAAREDLQVAVSIEDDADYRRELLARLTELGPAPTSTPEPTNTPEVQPTSVPQQSNPSDNTGNSGGGDDGDDESGDD
jgi:serine/threonine protein kinase/tetratricopeptide (TPR) repeat protein